MKCDIVPCLLWKTSLCIIFIQITSFSCNHIYLLMILIFHKFKVISLSFESPFMHIKHLKCKSSNNAFKFEHHFCKSNVHHSFPKFEKKFVLMIKSAKGVEINIKKLICHTYLHIWFKCVFGPLNYKIWWCVFSKSCSFLCGERHR